MGERETGREEEGRGEKREKQEGGRREWREAEEREMEKEIQAASRKEDLPASVGRVGVACLLKRQNGSLQSVFQDFKVWSRVAQMCFLASGMSVT